MSHILFSETSDLMDGEEVFVEHFLIFNDSESFLIPISKLFNTSNQTHSFGLGAKYRNCSI